MSTSALWRGFEISSATGCDVSAVPGTGVLSPLYAVFMLSLAAFAPGYIERTWQVDALLPLLPFGIPVEELLFGISFGAYWSAIYEHLLWLSGQRRQTSPLKRIAVAHR